MLDCQALRESVCVHYDGIVSTLRLFSFFVTFCYDYLIPFLVDRKFRVVKSPFIAFPFLQATLNHRQRKLY